MNDNNLSLVLARMKYDSIRQELLKGSDSMWTAQELFEELDTALIEINAALTRIK